MNSEHNLRSQARDDIHAVWLRLLDVPDCVLRNAAGVLEAFTEDQRLSTVLEPMDCTLTRAHDLIRCPCCALIAA